MTVFSAAALGLFAVAAVGLFAVAALLSGAFWPVALLPVCCGAVVVFGFCGPFSRPALLGVVLHHCGQVRGAGLPTRPGPIRARAWTGSPGAPLP